MSNIVKNILKELHGAYKKGDPTSNCLTRAQLLFLCLEKLGYPSKIMKLTIEGNDKKNFEDKEKFYHICGFQYPSHVVVLLNGKILDANLDPEVHEPRDLEKYKSDYIVYEPKEKLIFVEEKSKIDIGSCRHYAFSYNLKKIRKILGWETRNNYIEILKQIFVFLLSMLVFVSSTCVHEIGHGICCRLVGGSANINCWGATTTCKNLPTSYYEIFKLINSFFGGLFSALMFYMLYFFIVRIKRQYKNTLKHLLWPTIFTQFFNAIIEGAFPSMYSLSQRNIVFVFILYALVFVIVSKIDA
jgi:hypothetical protein